MASTTGLLDNPARGLSGIRMAVGLLLAVHGFLAVTTDPALMSRQLPVYGLPPSEHLAVVLIGLMLFWELALLAGLLTRCVGALLLLILPFDYVLSAGPSYAIMGYPKSFGVLFPISSFELFLFQLAFLLCLVFGGGGAFAIDNAIWGKSRQNAKRQERAVGALRVFLGVATLLHAWQKLMVYGISAVGLEFSESGLPVPKLIGVIISLLEVVAGVALLHGRFARWAGGVLAAVVAGSVLFIHLRPDAIPFNHGLVGYDYALLYTAACVSLAISGPGKLGLTDAVASVRLTRPGNRLLGSGNPRTDGT